jgi:hypothetical protein
MMCSRQYSWVLDAEFMDTRVDGSRRLFLRVAAQGVGGVAWSSVGGETKAAFSHATLPDAAPIHGANLERASTAAIGTIINADPSNYLIKLAQLKPGDTLVLASGNYGVGTKAGDPTGLPIFGINGTAGAPIVITGPETGARPVLMGRSTQNTIRLADASYVVVRRLEIDGRGHDGFGVAVHGPAHNITIEDNYFHGHGSDQSVVAISTAGSATWNWIIRRNLIVGAGTGMYLGSSTGGSPFVAGLIEHNVIRDTMGYNVQIKHQTAWSRLPRGMPTVKTTTVIRHNVFTKSRNSSTGANSRPNLLVGDGPSSGPGSTNGFAIYGNFFYGNPTESLFQGEGTIAFYGNVMVTGGVAIRIQPHNGLVRNVRIFHNTVMAGGPAIFVSGGASGYIQRVMANAVFAVGTPISVRGTGAGSMQNITDTQTNAVAYLNTPLAPVGSLDLYPKVGSGLKQGQVYLTGLNDCPDWDKDFNLAPRDPAYRGAYSGEGTNPGWALGLAIKP